MPRLPEWQKQGLDAPTPDTNKYQIQVLQEQHKQMARMIALGLGNEEIASELGCTPQMVSYVRNSAVTVNMVNDLDALSDGTTVEALKFIKEKAALAAKIAWDIADCEDAPLAVRLKAATELMDRAGVSKTITINDSRHGHFTQEDISRLKAEALRELNASAVEVKAEAIG